MKEKMICDYLKENNLKIYDDSEKISDINVVDSCVTVNEVSSCGYYKDHHSIDLIDLMSWVYSKTIAAS